MKKVILFLVVSIFIFTATVPVYALRTPGALQVPDKWRKAKKVRLWWGAVSDADYYKVQLRTKKNKKVKKFKYVTQNYKKVRPRYLKSNKPYIWRARSCMGGLYCTVYSPWDEFRTLPAKVKKVQLTEVTDECVTAKWKHVNNHKSVYYYMQLLDENNNYLGYQTTAKRSRQFCGLDSSTKYKVRIKAIYDLDNVGKYSKKKAFTTDAY